MPSCSTAQLCCVLGNAGVLPPKVGRRLYLYNAMTPQVNDALFGVVETHICDEHVCFAFTTLQ